MRNSLLKLLVDPIDSRPLTLEATDAVDGETILEGALAAGSHRYPISAGIPRLVVGAGPAQSQTAGSFAFKWQRRDTYDSDQMRAHVGPWMASRYGFDSVDDMSAFFCTRRRILDAGCGSGFSSSLWMNLRWADAATEWIGADISDAIDVARERLGDLDRTEFVQADMLAPPFRSGSFDTIFCEGALHHTPSTPDAFKALTRLVAAGGELMFYVYRRKAPIREFTDDHVRGAIAHLDPEAAWEAMRPLTELARALSEASVEIDVPDDIPALGIRAGRHDLQRLIYWHFAKLFWNSTLTFEENVHVNFDWYHPQYAHRHTEDEIRGWCDEAGLSIVHFDSTNESGFTVRARRG